MEIAERLGLGPQGGREAEHRQPDSVLFQVIRNHQDRAEMGWLRRSFKVPSGWGDKHILLPSVRHEELVRVLSGQETGRCALR